MSHVSLTLWSSPLRCVMMIGTGQFLQAEDDLLQRLHVGDLVQGRRLEFAQEGADGGGIEALGDGSQTIDAPRSRFKHVQDFLLHGHIADQLGLIHAAVLAQDVTVERRSDRSFHLQDPRIEVVASGAVRAVSVSGRGMTITRNRAARPVAI
mgnify:CR=1 FL=1